MSGIRTPWGEADHAIDIAFGITLYNTPSHGGYRLDAERQAKVAELFPDFGCDDGWYEEDCDAALVAIVFPDAFPPGSVELAHGMARYMAADWPKWRPVLDYIDIRLWVERWAEVQQPEIDAWKCSNP